MGIDEALLSTAVREGLATLRFYSWDRPWLSLGYAQTVSPSRLRACRDGGVGVLRRVTGGQAVLHGNDLTYCIAAPEAALAAGLRASYDQIGRALLRAVRRLGVAAARRASAAASGPPGTRPFDCFQAPAAGEICVDDRKLAGSAQRRAGGALLQHGSIRLGPDESAARGAAGQLSRAAVSLREAGCPADENELQDALEDVLSECFGARFDPGELSAAERAHGAARCRAHVLDPLAVPPFPEGALKRPF